MCLILSAHTDVVRNDIPLTNNKGDLNGLLDNMAGVICLYSAIYQNKSIQQLLATGRVRVFHSNYEEFGLTDDLPQASADDIVINIDVCSGDQYNNVDAGLENVYNIEDFDEILDSLQWEGFRFRVLDYKDATVHDEDEMTEWAKKGIPGLSFIIPIESPTGNWHGPCTISMEKMNKVILILQRLICYLS
jgi:hypothetical protein